MIVCEQRLRHESGMKSWHWGGDNDRKHCLNVFENFVRNKEDKILKKALEFEKSGRHDKFLGNEVSSHLEAVKFTYLPRSELQVHDKFEMFVFNIFLTWTTPVELYHIFSNASFGENWQLDPKMHSYWFAKFTYFDHPSWEFWPMFQAVTDFTNRLAQKKASVWYFQGLWKQCLARSSNIPYTLWWSIVFR